VNNDAVDPIEKAIAALEAQRPLLGDAAVDAAIAPLRAALAPAQTLRQVSVLFLDVVGSTALSQHLDPEDMAQVMDELLAAATAIVQAHGGRVLQYAGDSLLAVFGADGAREDDAERAVRCGLALVDEGAARAVLTLETHGHAGLHVRVGVHTGPVLLGGGVSEEASIRGHTVHVAARMEQTAPRGRLRISHDTWQQVRGVFDVEAQPPLAIKGQDAPMATWLVVGAKPRAFRVPSRGIEGFETPLVGRDAELGVLLAAFENVCRTRSFERVLIVADPGVGKSRLVQELQHRLDAHTQSFWLLLGRALPATRLQTYGLLRDVLAWRLQIADSDPATLARSRLVDGLLPLLAGDGVGEAEARAQAEVLGQLLGMDFSASPAVAALRGESRLLRDTALSALARVLRRLSASDGSPVVMLLEDLQWADDASLDALAWLQAQPELPLLAICSARVEFGERRPAWLAAGPGAAPAQHVIQLEALAGEQRRALSQALLARLVEPSPMLEAMIEQQAEGNPFYAEELIRMLLDDGVIVVDAERAGWRVLSERLRTARIPLTLTGVLQARLDGMGAAEKRALQRASIVGPVFWDDPLGADAAQLSAAQRRGMLLPHPESAFEGVREFAFQHHLLHQVTYDTVLKAEKRSGHAAIAAWLAARVGDREDEYLALTAEHYDRAGDHARAAEWFERACAAAQARFANRAALEFIDRLLALPDAAAPERRQVLLTRQRGLADLIGDRALQGRALEAIAQLEGFADRLDWQCDHAATRALWHDRLGETAAAFEWATRGAQLAPRSGDAASGVLAEGELAWLARSNGDIATARVHLARALAWCPQAQQQAADAGTTTPFVYDLQLLLIGLQVCLAEHDLDGAHEHATRALAAATDRGAPRMSALVHDAIATLRLYRFEFDEADRLAVAAETMAGRIGLLQVQGSATHTRAVSALMSGRWQQAIEIGESVMPRFEALSARSFLAETRFVCAVAWLQLGEPARAEALLRLALPYFVECDMQDETVATRTLWALAAWRQGRRDEARTLLEAAMPALADPALLRVVRLGVGVRAAAVMLLRGLGDAREAAQRGLHAQEIEARCGKVADAALRERLARAWQPHGDDDWPLTPRLGE
jgi:class 3 adenylate cyclase